MARTERMELWDAVRVPDWLQSDTDTSIVGTEWHQEAIGTLATMLRVVADRRDVPWGYTPRLPDEQGRLYSAALDIAIEVTQPLLGVRNRDGRLIETAVAMARRLEALEQRLHKLEQG
jgi:hypothetical protein